MPSHTADDPKKLGIAPSWMRRWHVLGNKQADLKADAGAAIDKIPACKAKDISWILHLDLIQECLIAVSKPFFPARTRAY